MRQLLTYLMLTAVPGSSEGSGIEVELACFEWKQQWTCDGKVLTPVWH